MPAPIFCCCQNGPKLTTRANGGRAHYRLPKTHLFECETNKRFVEAARSLPYPTFELPFRKGSSKRAIDPVDFSRPVAATSTTASPFPTASTAPHSATPSGVTGDEGQGAGAGQGSRGGGAEGVGSCRVFTESDVDAFLKEEAPVVGRASSGQSSSRKRSRPNGPSGGTSAGAAVDSGGGGVGGGLVLTGGGGGGGGTASAAGGGDHTPSLLANGLPVPGSSSGGGGVFAFSRVASRQRLGDGLEAHYAQPVQFECDDDSADEDAANVLAEMDVLDVSVQCEGGRMPWAVQARRGWLCGGCGEPSCLVPRGCRATLLV